MTKVFIEFTRPSYSYKKFSLFSWAIRALEGTKYSHVRLVMFTVTGKKVVYEASGTSVKFVGPIAQKEKKVDIIHSISVDVTADEFRELIDMCMEYADVSYGVLQVIGIALTHLPWFDKNPFQDGRRSQVCSELIGRFLQEIKDVYICDSELDIAGPKMIYLLVERLVEEREDFDYGYAT